MSDLGWRAEGMARARAAGGIELEKYRRPGFTSGIAVRRASEGGSCQGFESGHDPGPDGDDPTPDDWRRKP